METLPSGGASGRPVEQSWASLRRSRKNTAAELACAPCAGEVVVVRGAAVEPFGLVLGPRARAESILFRTALLAGGPLEARAHALSGSSLRATVVDAGVVGRAIAATGLGFRRATGGKHGTAKHGNRRSHVPRS